MVERVRVAIESTYDSICNIYTTTTTRNKYGQCKASTVTVCEGEQCRISAKIDNPSVDAEFFKDKKQTVKLFISPDITIPTGAKVIVIHNGRISHYNNAGNPFVYDTHQEVLLVSES